MYEDREATSREIAMFTIILVSILLVVFMVGAVAFPMYSIWQKEQSGRAQLAEAKYSRQIVIEEAQAQLEAERLNAQSEVERAKGAAEAIEIENGSLTPEYIQYLWVRSIDWNDSTIIYIPTEAGLPLLETQRLAD